MYTIMHGHFDRCAIHNMLHCHSSTSVESDFVGSALGVHDLVVGSLIVLPLFVGTNHCISVLEMFCLRHLAITAITDP